MIVQKRCDTAGLHHSQRQSRVLQGLRSFTFGAYKAVWSGMSNSQNSMVFQSSPQLVPDIDFLLMSHRPVRGHAMALQHPAGAMGPHLCSPTAPGFPIRYARLHLEHDRQAFCIAVGSLMMMKHVCAPYRPVQGRSMDCSLWRSSLPLGNL